MQQQPNDSVPEEPAEPAEPNEHEVECQRRQAPNRERMADVIKAKQQLQVALDRANTASRGSGGNRHSGTRATNVHNKHSLLGKYGTPRPGGLTRSGPAASSVTPLHADSSPDVNSPQTKPIDSARGNVMGRSEGQPSRGQSQ